MSALRLLDLYCCGGGASRGYQLAGFHVTGVDIEPQPHYIGDEFRLADALDYLAVHGHEFDAIAASPPCQHYSEMTPIRYRSNHADLIAPTRALLIATGRPYILENVPTAAKLLINPLKLCGSMFGLPIQRHRYFEFAPNFIRAVDAQRDRLFCRHISHPVLITDHGGPNANGAGKPRKRSPLAVKRQAIGIDWMTEDEITEAIPPAYTHYIGARLIDYLTDAAQSCASQPPGARGAP